MHRLGPFSSYHLVQKKNEEIKKKNSLKAQTDASRVVWACPHHHHPSHHVNSRIYRIKEMISTKKNKEIKKKNSLKAQMDASHVVWACPRCHHP